MPILFLYYDLSVCPLLLNYNKVYLPSSLIAKPNEGPIKEEHYTSSISVDEQTLIGQAGGLLGILLGWSGMTLSDLINPTLNLLLESSFSLE